MEVSLMGSSWFVAEVDGRDERLEIAFLFADQIGRTFEREKPRFLAVRQHSAKDALIAVATGAEVHALRLVVAHLDGTNDTTKFRFIDGVGANLPAPALDVGEQSAALAGQRHPRRLGLVA